MVGVGQEVPNRLGARFAMAELGEDIFDGYSLRDETLLRSVGEQGHGCFHERPRAENDVVRAVADACEKRLRRSADFGRSDGRLVDDQIASSRIRHEVGASSVHPSGRGRVADVQDNRERPDARNRGRPSFGPRAPKLARFRDEAARVGDAEPIQHYRRIARFGIPDVLDLEDVLTFSQKARTDVGGNLARRLTVPALFREESLINKDTHVVIGGRGGVARSLERDFETRGLDRAGKRGYLERVALRDRSEQKIPEPEVRSVEERCLVVLIDFVRGGFPIERSRGSAG